MQIKTYNNQDFQIIREDDNTVHDRALRYCKEHSEASYRESVLAVLRADAELARKYYNRTEEPPEDTSGCLQARTYSQCEADLNEQVLEYMAAHPGFAYPDAQKVIWGLPKNKLMVQKYTRNSARRCLDSD